MLNSIFIMFVFSSIFMYNVEGSSLDDLRQIYTNMLMECATDHPITAEDSELLKKRQMPENENFKCLLACAYKKTGMMDDQGELSIQGVHEISEKYLSDDPEAAKKSKEFTESCISVNAVPVSDGTKGCERAALIFKCSVEKLLEFGVAL